MDGKDCIGCAKTGSGKTLAFALPILHQLSNDPYGIYALVLTPTRELAFQICDQFIALGKPIGISCEVVTGGRDIILQGTALANRPHVVVATPGRLADHIRSGVVSFENLKFVVLDEADRLVDGAYDEDLASIFKILPDKRQTLMFSATMTDSIKRVKQLTSSGNANLEPMFWTEHVAAEENEVKTVASLNQKYVLVPPGGDVREALMVQILLDFREKNEHGSAMIFTRTCKECQVISMMLAKLGFSCVPLHSKLKQSQRLSSLSQFKSLKSKVLVATDVASRGLDIPQVDLVINHSIPEKPKDYIHRVGRTARAGRDGTAITLMNPNRDVIHLHSIEKLIGIKMEERRVPDRKSLKILTQVSVLRRESEVHLMNEGFEEKTEINKRKAWILRGEMDEIKPLKRQRLKK